MKLRNVLFAVVLSLAFISCGDDDEPETSCKVCEFSIPIIGGGDCSIEVCADGASTSTGGDLNCAVGETAITAASATTQDDKVAALESVGYTCN